jgi:hypothetical protein
MWNREARNPPPEKASPTLSFGVRRQRLLAQKAVGEAGAETAPSDISPPDDLLANASNAANLRHLDIFYKAERPGLGAGEAYREKLAAIKNPEVADEYEARVPGAA